MAAKRAAGVRYRRSPHLVCYWQGSSLVVHNYATSVRAAADALVCDLLDHCGTWRTAAALRRRLAPASDAQVARLTRRLVDLTFLRPSGCPEDPRERAMRALDRWNPAAGFFHTATRDVRFADPRQAWRDLERQARTWPMPSPLKRYRAAATVPLPPPEAGDPVARAFLARRTWRRFSREPLPLADLAGLLGLSMGVQRWVRVGGRDLPLKTFPSGGARHPIECYVVATRVADLAPGIYHYASDRHGLERLRPGASAVDLRRYLPRSGHFASAAALVLFTAVFERQVWRYPYARAYRAALVEAGHACQTFCVAAAARGLAPFSVMGLADSAIDADLGLDGVGESVLYAAGVGRPPAGAEWAPLVRGTLPVRPNPHLVTKTDRPGRATRRAAVAPMSGDD